MRSSNWHHKRGSGVTEGGGDTVYFSR